MNYQQSTLPGTDIALSSSLDISPDPTCLGKYLIRCPICNQYRSVKSRQKRKILKTRNANCWKCGTYQANAKAIPTSDSCIIIEPFHSTIGRETRSLVECPICHQQRTQPRVRIRRTRHTMCRDCFLRVYQVGPNHPKWNGYKGAYYGADWQYITESIRYRDGYRCQYPECQHRISKTGRALDIHHIIPFIESYDNSPFNLISLCLTHHRWADYNLLLSMPMFDNMIMSIYGPDYR